MKFNINTKEKLFFTSDLHLSHENIIKYCNRPFSSVGEMDEYLISNWNEEVGKKDRVVMAGDFVFKNKRHLIDRLNGEIIWVVGNHDYDEFGKATSYKYVEIGYGDIVICVSHYPMLAWNKKSYGSYMLHGHCHGTMNDKVLAFDKSMKILDVGVDSVAKIFYNDLEIKKRYRPISILQIKQYMDKKA